MTWEQWIDSDYNPYLPNGSKKRFGKTSDEGEYSGYVWYHIWDDESNQIDISTEIIDITNFQIVNLGDKIIEDNTYDA